MPPISDDFHKMVDDFHAFVRDLGVLGSDALKAVEDFVAGKHAEIDAPTPTEAGTDTTTTTGNVSGTTTN